MKWTRRGALVLAAALAWAGSAAASPQSDSRLDAVASGVAGFPVVVVGENDPTAWAAEAPSQEFAAYSYPTADASQTAYYHRVFIGPAIWMTLEAIENNGAASVDPYQAAGALMTLIHETEHVRLASTDEGRVNACALQAFPSVISSSFGVSETDSKPSRVAHDTPVYRRVHVVRYVREHGKRVKRAGWIRKRVGTHVTYTNDGPPVAVPNLTFQRLVNDAQVFYDSQPAAYHGTCS